MTSDRVREAIDKAVGSKVPLWRGLLPEVRDAAARAITSAHLAATLGKKPHRPQGHKPVSEKVGHTPERWATWHDDVNDVTRFVVLADQEEIVIAELPYMPSFVEETEAHARLIAAAPELLEALEELLFDAFEEVHPDSVQKARAAIKKARGDG